MASRDGCHLFPPADCGAGKPSGRVVWLVWSRAFGFYEPPFVTKKKACTFARIENETMENESQRARVLRAVIKETAP